MIALFTDFGLSGPYIGQLKAVLAQAAPGEPVIDLFADLPPHNVPAASHLLAAYHREFPPGTIFLCVVDPGVGSAQREPVLVQADEHWFVGPGNGLFDVVAARGTRVESWRITWRPQRLSASFHGRDLFAPVAAMLARGEFPQAQPLERTLAATAGDDLAAVIYVDHFGNLITGLRADNPAYANGVSLCGKPVPRCRTFSDVEPGQPLCYENSSGLLEIAVNCGRADRHFGVGVDTRLEPVGR